MDSQSSSRKSLVVGGSRGLGLAIADDLAARGLPVTIASRFPPPDNREGHTHLSSDLSRVAELGLGALSDVIADCDLTFVVAARGCFGAPEAIARQDAFETVATTFVGNVLVLSHAVTTMRPGSSICWISSLSAHAATTNWAFYAASKAGVGHFIECLKPVATEREVSLTVAYPGNFKSTFHEVAGAHAPSDGLAPSDIAGKIVEATIKRLSSWIAPMDHDALAWYLDVLQDARGKLNHALR